MRCHLLTPWALTAALLAQGQRPTDEELDSAQPAAADALAERLLANLGGDVTRTANELLMAALTSEDHATRYLLWQRALRFAERSCEAWVARNVLRAMAHEFDVDADAAGVELLRRMAAANAEPARTARIALAAMYSAAEYSTTDEALLHRYFDVAVRAALRTEHAPLYAFVRDRLAFLRAPRRLGAELASTLADSHRAPIDAASDLVCGGLLSLEPFAIADLRPILGDAVERAGIAADRTVRSLQGAELLALADRVRDPEVRDGCVRLARTRFVRDYATAGDDERATLFAAIVDTTERLARADGVSRLRFDRADDERLLAFANGDWRVEDGALVGTAQGADNFATHRVRFAGIDAAVIRGGIRSDAGLNFRCKVGDANLLLNWEVEPQNHLWIKGRCFRRGPRALTTGEAHTILVFQDGNRVHVAIDGRHLWTAPCILEGTVSVYPALGSEIFVDEILIDGAPDGLVDAPIGPMM